MVKEGTKEIIHFRIDTGIREYVEKIAKADNVDKSEVFRELMEEAYEKRQANNKAVLKEKIIHNLTEAINAAEKYDKILLEERKEQEARKILEKIALEGYDGRPKKAMWIKSDLINKLREVGTADMMLDEVNRWINMELFISYQEVQKAVKEIGEEMNNPVFFAPFKKKEEADSLRKKKEQEEDLELDKDLRESDTIKDIGQRLEYFKGLKTKWSGTIRVVWKIEEIIKKTERLKFHLDGENEPRNS